jgi:hypothetical protein
MKGQKTPSSKTINKSLKFPADTKPLPHKMIGLCFALPDDVDLSRIQWGPEPDADVRAKLERAAEAQRVAELARKEEIARVVEHVLALPPDEFRAWLQEQQRRADAAVFVGGEWGAQCPA